MEAAREKLAKAKGASALEPWNLSHALSGDVEKCVAMAFPGYLVFAEVLDAPWWSAGWGVKGCGALRCRACSS